MLEKLLNEIKAHADPDELGMILVHNGIVRGTAKNGKPVKRMKLSFDPERLGDVVETYKQKEGIVDIKVWINAGELEIGEDIMYLVVAGRFRNDVLPIFNDLLTYIKNDVVSEVEIA